MKQIILIAFTIATSLLAEAQGNGAVLHQVHMLRNEKGANVFNANFATNASGRNDKNAYLLSYLATAIYADKILELESPHKTQAALAQEEIRMQTNSNAFVQKFRKVVSPYFSTSTQYQGGNMEFFENNISFDGYDPEAMIIPANNEIFITFRGTDRVAQRNAPGSLQYNVTEWIHTDFQALKMNPGRINGVNARGLVHQGMWLSLMKVADTMAKRVQLLGGANKKVWITGHSLGGGMAQLFAYYLAKAYNIKPQGIYVYAAPAVGDAVFNTDFNAVAGADKLQRFDFMDDPVTALAQPLGFVSMGTRVAYTNINTKVFSANERSTGEVARIIAGVPLSLTTIANLPALGGMCYHQQNWYMQAAYRQLNEAQKSVVPNPLPVPNTTYMGCLSGIDISRAVNPNNATTQVVNHVLDVTDAVLNNIATALGNMTGSILPQGEGKYKITCLQGGKTLGLAGRCDDQNGCQAILWQDDGGDNMRFQVFKYGLGYGLRVKSSDKVLDVAGQSTANGARVKTWAQHSFPVLPNNQIWYLHNVGGNKYVIQNERSGKVLDADNPNTGNNGCEVMQWQYWNGGNNQVWVFEKVN